MPFGKLFSGSKSKNAGGQPDSATKKSSKKMHKKDQLLDLFDKCEQRLIGPEMAASLLRENKDHCKKIGKSGTLRTRLSQLSRRFRMPINDLIYSYVDDAAYLKDMIQLRFNVSMGSADNQMQKDEKKWSAETLRRAYQNFLLLPEDHLVRLRTMKREKESLKVKLSGTTSGDANSRSMHINYQFSGLSGKTYGLPEQIAKPFFGGIYDAGDRMTGLNAFDTTFIHEIGHTVDDATATNPIYSSRPDFRQLDGTCWSEYKNGDIADSNQLFDDMLACYGVNGLLPAGITDKYNVNTTVRNAASSMINRFDNQNKGEALSKDYVKNRVAAQFSKGNDDKVEDLTKEFLKSKFVALINHGRAKTEAFMQGPFGGGSRQFVQGYEGDKWYSYNTSALSGKISRYQFREPCEDFAETYALYYTAPQKLSSHRRMWFRAVVLQNPASRVKFQAMTGIDPEPPARR